MTIQRTSSLPDAATSATRKKDFMGGRFLFSLEEVVASTAVSLSLFLLFSITICIVTENRTTGRFCWYKHQLTGHTFLAGILLALKKAVHQISIRVKIDEFKSRFWNGSPDKFLYFTLVNEKNKASKSIFPFAINETRVSSTTDAPQD